MENVIQGWRNLDPYSVTREVDSDTGRIDYIFHLHHQLPQELPAIVGDVIHNLRSALDHLYIALIEEHGGKLGNHESFPIVSNADNLESALGAKDHRPSKHAVRLIKALKPYKGGTDGYWALHKLDIRDKHRLLLTTIVEKDSVTLTLPPLGFMRLGGPSLRKRRVRARSIDREPLEDGTIIRTVMPGGVDMEPEQSFHVAIYEPPIIKGKPIIPCLQELIDLTERTIDIFAIPFFFKPLSHS